MSSDRYDIRLSIPKLPSGWWTKILPSFGNVIFTCLMIGGLLWAQSVGAISLGAPLAASTSTGTLAYQGRLANSSGQPLTQTVNMIFRLYGTAGGGTPLWEEQWTGSNSVQVSDGLFNVMLGSLTPIPQAVITGNSNLFLGITVGTDSEMSPRVQLGSVPFATQALTVPDGSITKAKLAVDVTLVPPDGSITTAKLANGAATGFWYKIGNTDATINSVSGVVIPDMVSDITTVGGPVEIHFDAGFAIIGDPNAGEATFSIVIDGQERTRHSEKAFISTDSTNVQIEWAELLSAGAHNVQVKWWVSSASVQARINAASNAWERSVLTIHEYRR